MAELRLRDEQGPARGDQVGPNPTDRAKNGTKRGVLTEAEGGPVAVVVAGANVHDSLLLQDGLEAVVVEPPNPLEHEQHLCLDKAFAGAPSDATARVFGYEPHVRPMRAPDVELFFKGEEPWARRGAEEWPLGDVKKDEMAFSPDRKRFAYVREKQTPKGPAPARVLRTRSKPTATTS